MIFTDHAGRTWRITDYVVRNGAKRRVVSGASDADGRAFVSEDSTVLLYEFGSTGCRLLEPPVLEEQLLLAKPWSATR